MISLVVAAQWFLGREPTMRLESFEISDATDISGAPTVLGMVCFASFAYLGNPLLPCTHFVSLDGVDAIEPLERGRITF